MMSADPRWQQMVEALQDSVSSYDGKVGLYVKDLKSGKTFEYNSDQRFVCASLIKLPIMVATCEAIKEGRLSLDTRIRYRRQFRRAGSGEMKWTRFGSVFPLSALLYAMITHSDNTATAMVIDQLGYDYLNAEFSQFGLEATRIHPTGMSLSNYIDPSLDNYTTPREMGGLLEKIYKHQVVGDGLCDLMLEIMKRANSRNRLAKDLPRNWALARKTGLLRKNCHDVGIVFSPSGDYVICVLTGQNHNYRVAKGFIANVGRKAYEILGNS
jgi:beta-lactamase class A